MNKLLLFFLSVLFSASLTLTGCGNSGESSETSDVPAKTEVTTEAPAEENLETAQDKNEVPALLDVADFSDAMMIVDPLLLSSVETGKVYNVEDATYVWKSLIYGTGIYFTGTADAEITAYSLVVPGDSVQKYAAAMFSDCTQLPQIPDSIDITYDEAKDAYLFPLGDRGASYSEILNVKHGEADTIILEAALFSAADEEKTVIASAIFTLIPNPDAEATLFPYSVVSMELAD